MNNILKEAMCKSPGFTLLINKPINNPSKVYFPSQK